MHTLMLGFSFYRVLNENFQDESIQRGAKVGIQLRVHETEFILDYYLLIVVLFTIRTTVNLLLLTTVYVCVMSR